MLSDDQFTELRTDIWRIRAA